ncbi:hypothetical protein BT96DRAFT_957686 [Gymnopus androsaceus JB14]|uniref:Uncharacterized protein n=1 Tax=Gymnopus androsaceus JB14 TaxID=1447944 RepID=A0A6A4HHK6_9AGAR|nr:hypothetical protein BT96DRAFT_957686 [Gymnopus androsaceus JB14]
MSVLYVSRITSNNTALMTTYYSQESDLSPYGGSFSGYLYNSVMQELNITSREPIFTWYASDWVDPSECYNAIGTRGGLTSNAWDIFIYDGNYLISSRHCYMVYLLNGTSGDIIWQMGGANLSFAMGDGANFSWQHQAWWITRNNMDNKSSSQGLHQALNFTSISVELMQDFIPHNYTILQSQGSVQLQPNGSFLTGYAPWWSGYTLTGGLIWTAQFGVNGKSYNEACKFQAYSLSTNSRH